MIWRTPKYTGPERRRAPRWRPRPLRVLAVLLSLAAAGYMLAVVWLVTQESRLVSRAGRVPVTGGPPFAYETVEFPRPDGVRQFGWVMVGHSDPDAAWIIYLHGNATTIESAVNISHYRLLRAVGLNVLAPEYRGFGGLDGVPTEASLRTDAGAAYVYLRETRQVSPSRILLYGWSLGAAAAIDLAVREQFPALVLEAAPASLADLAQQRYPFFPLRLLMRNKFDSTSRIARLSSPALFLHSPEDEVIPISEGRRLFEAAAGAKAFVELRGGHFDAVEVDQEHMKDAISGFLTERGVHLAASARPAAP